MVSIATVALPRDSNDEGAMRAAPRTLHGRPDPEADCLDVAAGAVSARTAEPSLSSLCDSARVVEPRRALRGSPSPLLAVGEVGESETAEMRSHPVYEAGGAHLVEVRACRVREPRQVGASSAQVTAAWRA